MYIISYISIIDRLCKIAHTIYKTSKVRKKNLLPRFHFFPRIFTNMNSNKNPRSTDKKHAVSNCAVFRDKVHLSLL